MFCMVLKNSFGNSSAEVNRHSLYIQQFVSRRGKKRMAEREGEERLGFLKGNFLSNDVTCMKWNCKHSSAKKMKCDLLL